MLYIKKEIIIRTLNEAKYMIKTEETIRQIALIFNVSKSTVHKDLQERLKYIDENIYNKITIIIKKHLEIRHIKGGESTKLKYKLKH
ncbi:MAG: sporulation transcriptional regulator SpoIIID [Bacilli bacterium]